MRRKTSVRVWVTAPGIVAATRMFLIATMFVPMWSALPAQSSLIDDGFQLLPAFSERDQPGIIFRRTRDNKRFEVTALVGLTVVRDSLVVPAIELSRDVEASIAARLLHIPFGANADASKTRKLELRIGPAVRLLTTDAEVRREVQRALVGQTWTKDSHYYLIREVIRTRSVAFNVSSGTAVDAGGEAEIKKAVEAKVGMSWKSDSKYQITQTLATPFTVLVKLEELVPPRAGAGGTGAGGVLFRPVKQMIVWDDQP